jgi:hypothetical protein
MMLLAWIAVGVLALICGAALAPFIIIELKISKLGNGGAGR